MMPSASPGTLAPRIQLPGMNLLRAIAVLAVVYSHISYYLIDDRASGWWVIDGVYLVFIRGLRLNQHLSFVGVAIFMVITGLLITGSALRNRPGKFLINRIGRLLPLLWISVAAAIILVRLGINGMFSGQPGITGGQAALSFALGGFFLKPEVAVLGVTWTLLVQILFYLYCVAARPLLRIAPIALPILGALLCTLVLLYNFMAPQPATVPMLSKIAATLPAVFIGQIVYFAWARLVSWRWIVVATIAQIEVVRLASDVHAYWGGDRYMWTIGVVAITLLLLGKRDGPIARSSVVRWIGTRSYPIYLVHTLILYRAYDYTVGHLGTTGAIAVFLVVTGLVSEVLYRCVEVPAGRWISARFSGEDRDEGPRSIESCPGTTNSSAKSASTRIS